jgi:hypothetical protein
MDALVAHVVQESNVLFSKPQEQRLRYDPRTADLAMIV